MAWKRSSVDPDQVHQITAQNKSLRLAYPGEVLRIFGVILRPISRLSFATPFYSRDARALFRLASRRLAAPSRQTCFFSVDG